MSRVAGDCDICDRVAPAQLVELDLLMGDSSRWPATVWRDFKAPTGPIIPAPMRRWGAVRLGQQYLEEHGYADLMQRGLVRRHENHVPVIAVDPDTLVANGVLASGGDKVPDHRLNPLAYLEFYSKGIEAGTKGIELLLGHVAGLEAKKIEVPLTLIKLLVDVGAKLSVSQAQIKSREPSQPALDDDEGFRAGAGGLPGPRFDHTRIRNVGGVDRPVHDEGPADRATYNERARQEGSEQL